MDVCDICSFGQDCNAGSELVFQPRNQSLPLDCRAAHCQESHPGIGEFGIIPLGAFPHQLR